MLYLKRKREKGFTVQTGTGHGENLDNLPSKRCNSATSKRHTLRVGSINFFNHPDAVVAIANEVDVAVTVS